MSTAKLFRPAFRRALLPMLVGAALAAAWTSPVVASSHREAPFIAAQPQLDATDFYMFMSYESGRAGYVTLVANYLPLQDPYGGPNYFKLDPERLVRDPRHQRRRRGREHHVPVQVPDDARRQPAHGRRQEGVDPAGAERLGRRQLAELERAQRARKVHAERDPRPAAHRHADARHQRDQGWNDVRQAGRLHRHEDDLQLRRVREPAHLGHLDSRMLRAPAACSSASARTRSSSTWAKRSTSSTSSIRRSN